MFKTEEFNTVQAAGNDEARSTQELHYQMGLRYSTLQLTTLQFMNLHLTTRDVIKLILSGNNLKLVRRPGGVTAWVPDKMTEGGGGGGGAGGGGGMGQAATVGQGWGDRPLRTRHASLDLEQGMEVVL
ncbi:hypothetical protein Pcinc_041854 [Petrolisthes cinctipes]|uniref:Uncharacterized protein n=1 Tax=Petrolisthes cinctipes TaxID=88211 RepID=A0AAE1EGI1_PETCI|nr:hypothetical protein Pcinc_041854 [Petrolisthes cinctipes]